MISQILGFSVFFVLVFGGIIGAIVKFTLVGSVKANLNNRIGNADERIDGALNHKQEKTDAKQREDFAQPVDKDVCGDQRWVS